MANEVRFDVVAKDSASKILDDVADKAEKVEQSDPTVDVKADAGPAKHTVEGFEDQLDRLTDTDKVVVLALRAGQAQAELADLATDIATIDATDPDIDVKFARYAEVSGQLDQLEGQIKTLGTTGDADLGKVSSRLDGIGESASGAQGAVHSMAGGAIGDFASTATGIGPLGEALGQLTEQAAAGEASFKELAVAGAGMAGLAAAVYVVQKAMASVAQTKAFHKDEVDAYRQSIKETGDALDDLQSRLTEAGAVMGSPSLTNASNWLGLSDSVRDVTAVLHEAGLTVESYGTLVAGSKEDVVAWGQAQKDAGTFTHDTVEAMDLIIQAQADVQAATDASTTSSAFFESQQRATNAEGERWKGIAAAYKAQTDKATGATDGLTRAQLDVQAAMRESGRALDELRGNLSDDQAAYDLAAAFDTVRQSSKDAEQAIKEHSDTASEKLTKEATDTIALKQAVIDYGTEVLGLPDAQVVDIVSHVNDTELDQLEARLETIRRNANINVQIIDKGGAGYGPSGTPRSVPSLSAAAAPARWARINGR